MKTTTARQERSGTIVQGLPMDVSEPRPGEYRTSDLYLSAFLIVSGVTMARSVKDRKGKVYFFFEDAEGHVNEIKDSYFNCKGKVSARKMADEIRTLKHLIHS